MSFKFPYTCPDINEAMEEAESEVSSHMEETIDDVVETIESYGLEEFKRMLAQEDYVGKSAKELYENHLVDKFEKLRTLNSNMREAAEEQILEYVTVNGENEEAINALTDSLLEAIEEAEELRLELLENVVEET